MKRHPLSMACAYAMLVALIVFGLAGLALTYRSVLPAAWAPLVDNAQTAIIVSLAVAFVGAAIASMRSAWHAERAHQAGPEHRHIMWLALAYSAICIVIEVAIGKLGAVMLGAQVSVWALVALLTFFAVAPRLVAVILAGMEGIERAVGAAGDAVEHERTLDRIRAVGETTATRIHNGEENRRAHLRTVGMIGAAASVAGLTTAAIPAEAVETPTVEIPAAKNWEAGLELGDSDAATVPSKIWRRGPKSAHRDLFVDALNIVRERPDINPNQLRRELEIDHRTAKQWLGWIRAIIDSPANAGLFDIAT